MRQNNNSNNNNNNNKLLKPWQKKLHEVIFEADTIAGRTFDITLLIAIIVSVLVVMLESVAALQIQFHHIFTPLEWGLTILFTIEYIVRILSVKRPLTYIFSFYGIVDLLSILPSYLSLFIFDTHSLTVIRSLRLMRVFRILKLGKYIKEAQRLQIALKNAKTKIILFIGTVLTMVIILGTLMYLIETPEAGFTSIPRSIYWAIVTLTTVGYGDIYPASVLGQFIAAMVMILGYAIIAVPTGIVTNEMLRFDHSKITTLSCENCSKDGHDKDAKYCKYCSHELGES